MAKKIILFMIVCIIYNHEVFAAWQDDLEAEFPFVQTFDNLNDWTATGTAGDTTNSSYMPTYTSGGGLTPWRYYSNYVTPTGAGITNHGANYVVNPKGQATSKSLLIDLYAGRGPSRLAADLRSTNYPNGFQWSSGVRVFYAMRRDTGFWSGATQYAKEFVLNMECNNYSCSQQYSAANYSVAPYFDYHHTHENGVNPAVLVSNSHGYITEPSPRTNMSVYDGQWIFVEYLYTLDDATRTARLSGWIYDSSGNLLDHIYDNRSSTAFSESDWASVSVGYFDNAMFGGNYFNPPSGAYMYFDDLIVDSDANGPIASRYFALASEATPTCSDGIQNGDETGVDCGGSCSACSGASMPIGAGTMPIGAGSMPISVQ